jgi:hypothetical protein
LFTFLVRDPQIGESKKTGLYDDRSHEFNYVHVSDVPSPPLGPLGIYGISSDSLTITWYPSEKNGGSPILDYSVEIKQESKKWKHVATVTKTSAKIEKLSANVTYEFRICARNEIGTSLPYTSDEKVTIGKTRCKYCLIELHVYHRPR